MSKESRARREANARARIERPNERIPLGGTAAYLIDSIDVGPFYESNDCSGTPTQVHVRLFMKDHLIPLVVRLHSQEAVDMLILQLKSASSIVWPELAEEVGEGGAPADTK